MNEQLQISQVIQTLQQKHQQQKLEIQDLINVFGGALHGENKIIHGLKALDNPDAHANDIGFLHKSSYFKQLATTKIGILITDLAIFEKIKDTDLNLTILVTENPYLYYAKIAAIFEKPRLLTSFIHETAIIGENVIIGENCIIEAGCVIQENVTIGNNCHLYPRVMIYNGCELGNDIIIHSGTVIGSDGFGFAPNFKPENGSGFAWQKIPQLGIVKIGHGVEIGANTTIDRGALNNTIIGNHVKLDNQIQIAHNVEIGDFTVIAACTGIAGSTKIGKFCQIGGSCNIMGHIEIVDGCIISATTFISRSLTKKGQYTGAFPFSEHHEWEKNVVFIKYLHRLKKLFLAKNN